MNKRFMVFRHQNKEQAYVAALLDAGYQITNQHEEAAFVLSDSDVLGNRIHLESCRAYGAQAFLYPHSAMPPMYWDGVFDAWPHTKCHFVVTECHAEVMLRYGYPRPLQVVGWSLCPLKPFKPHPNPRRVLFAPIHSNGNGWLSDWHKGINRESFQKLLTLVHQGDIDLTVRCINNLELHGLWREDGVLYRRGEPNGDYDQIDAADVVVSHGTFAYLAVARGVPTVMLAEWLAPHMGHSEREFQRVASWGVYKDLVMYPLSILDSDDTLTTLRLSARDDIEIADWRRRMIGEPFDGRKFVSILEGYLYGNLGSN